MPRKRRPRGSGHESKSVSKKQKRKRRLSARDKKIAQLTVNSTWRVKTADKEITAAGKVVYEQWSRCKIIARLQADKKYPEGAVQVKYLEDAADEEAIIYDIGHFILNSMAAPRHLVDLVSDTSPVSITLEQPKFEQQERGELLPLQRRRIIDPKTWKKNKHKFDEESW